MTYFIKSQQLCKYMRSSNIADTFALAVAVYSFIRVSGARVGFVFVIEFLRALEDVSGI